MTSKRIKIEEIGDLFAGRTKSLIRLKGRWLNQAGFNPGNHVEITFPESGKLVLTSENLPSTGAPEESEKPTNSDSISKF